MNRRILWGVLAIGLALIVAPLALSLPSKSSAGERMMDSFRPIMRPGQVATTARYYNDVFVPLGKVSPMMSAANVGRFQAYLAGFRGVQGDAAKLVPMLAQTLHMTPAQVQSMMGARLPAMSAMLKGLPAMQADFALLLGAMQQNTGIFAQVPAGLKHYEPLVTTMQANVDNYAQVNSLPDFRLFSVFFIAPGVLLVLLAGFGLFGARTAATLHAHHGPRPTPA
jgi:hypothetical protein